MKRETPSEDTTTKFDNGEKWASWQPPVRTLHRIEDRFGKGETARPASSFKNTDGGRRAYLNAGLGRADRGQGEQERWREIIEIASEIRIERAADEIERERRGR